MFVGGSSGSTAGGVKTVTMGLVVLSAVNTMRGRRQVTVFGRSISQEDISNAVSVALLVLGLSLFGAAVLTVCDRWSFLNAIYETIFRAVHGRTDYRYHGHALRGVQAHFDRLYVLRKSRHYDHRRRLYDGRPPKRVQYAETKVMIG